MLITPHKKNHETNHHGLSYSVGAGGIADGEAVAACLALGAEAVWVGTRFICASESGASHRWQETVIRASPSETMRTLVATGRPCRMYMTPYIKKWETERKDESEFEGHDPQAKRYY